MALTFIGSGQYLKQGSAIISSMPITFACWFNPTAIGATGTLISLGSTAVNNYYAMIISSTGSLISQHFVPGKMASTAASVMTVGTWYHCAAVFESTTSRYAYVNGVSAHNGILNTAATVNITSIGANFTGTNTAVNVLNGALAYPAIWNTMLTPADILALSRGASPRMNTGGLVSYARLTGGNNPEPDMILPSSWTVV